MKKNYKSYFEANQKRWDELVSHHIKSRYYDLEGFKHGKTSLLPTELKELTNLEGKSLLHLQCHFGMDTLSWARDHGAIVTGLDFSENAIEMARELSDVLEIPATFIQANVYDIPTVIHEQFDVVFTSYGVLCWLPDLTGWAKAVSHCMKSGGRFYIVDTHPYGEMLDERYSDRVSLGYPYTSKNGVPHEWEEDGTYADPEGVTTILKNKTEYGWYHSMSEIINALLQAGLHLEFLHESTKGFFKYHPDMVKRADGLWEFKNMRPEIPLTFSLLARKP
ncbi:hypothetical protein NEF87_002963 [Candidatus Lokiarchaeum ossiferum]|uniref:Methyltransferase type 11 domain-containing protein n=1 Tax=Candidatus Lokiarchaeum ossiferum TaxID=2951803 RepID=A0ABY6HT35_9ARCH|nr:hypothetical protein NEF87_002963 [Candidatus Lokiarchaeum sp. B-35]